MRTQPLSEVYHQWTVLGFAYKDKHNTYYKCRCTCGVEKEIRIYDLINNKTTKLNKEKVKDIRFCLEQNIKIKDLAILYHVARETINGIKHYRNWKDI